MVSLSQLKNTHRKKVSTKRVGRGIGSGKGKTCARGAKGAKSRSGYKRRHGREGGQLPMFKRIPIRGFTRGIVLEETFVLNLVRIDTLYMEGETVSLETLKAKTHKPKKRSPIGKLLGNGKLSNESSRERSFFSE